MSGPRPAHVKRRGGVYAIRFRVPVDLIEPLGLKEFHRSLATSSPLLARRRAALVTVWWRQTIESLRRMPNPTADDLKQSASAFFAMLVRDANQPRGFDPEHFDEEVSMNVEASRSRQADLDDQLRDNMFDDKVTYAAGRIARRAGGALDALTPASRLYALQLAAAAEREQMRFLVHSLTTPHLSFEPVFGLDVNVSIERATASRAPAAGPELAWCVEQYLDRKRRQGVQESQVSEVSRSLKWLIELLGGHTRIDAVTADNARAFRDGLERLDKRHRGKSTAFLERLTDDAAHHNKPVMATKYWSSAQAFFAWCHAEGHSQSDPAHGIKTLNPVNVSVRTPPPFSRAELVRLFETPLYAGHESPKRLLAAGSIISKGSYYWSGLIALYTGMRAGEIAQLQIADFDFAGSIPVIRVSDVGDPKTSPKKVKTKASIRDVPIASVLLELGLQEFVASRAKGTGAPRVFPDIKFGAGDRRSDGLTKFWGRLLQKFDLHEPGRATHVFRHTAANAMRNAGVTNEIIGWVLGHASPLEADGYGKVSPVAVTAEAIAKIDYAFDVVAKLRENEAHLLMPVDDKDQTAFHEDENVV